MAQRILSVMPSSPAARAGIRAGRHYRKNALRHVFSVPFVITNSRNKFPILLSLKSQKQSTYNKKIFSSSFPKYHEYDIVFWNILTK